MQSGMKPAADLEHAGFAVTAFVYRVQLDGTWLAAASR
jgi:hypothetical protein